jgi:hypothetical protein
VNDLHRFSCRSDFVGCCEGEQAGGGCLTEVNSRQGFLQGGDRVRRWSSWLRGS